MVIWHLPAECLQAFVIGCYSLEDDAGSVLVLPLISTRMCTSMRLSDEHRHISNDLSSRALASGYHVSSNSQLIPFYENLGISKSLS